MKKIFLKNNLHDSGFTLIEVLVAVSIFAIVVLITMNYIFQGYNMNRFSLEMSDATEYAKKGIETMVKEVREASYGDNGDYPIVQADAQSFTFYSDIDTDAVIEKVRYSLAGTNLIRGVINPTAGTPVQYLSANEATTTIAQYIQNGANPIFYYYNGNYPQDTINNPMPQPVSINAVRLIRLLLTINIDPYKAPDNFDLDMFVTLRNLKDNL